MNDGLEYGAMREDDVPAVARIVSLAFTGTRDAGAEWLKEAGHEHFRVARDGERGPVGCALRIPMGQWFGGRSVPLIGVAGVGVAPEGRGRGVAKGMMAAALREMHEEGIPVSGLYCSTQALYRSVGYEQAGHRFEIRLPVSAIDVRERGMAVRAIGETDQEGVRACYRAFASRFDGPLDRGRYVWARVEKSRDGRFDGFAAVDESGKIEGYVYLLLRRKPERGRQEIILTDLAFTSVRAGRRLLAFLANFGSLVDEVIFFGGPMHPALFLLSQQRFRIDLRDHWMLRIVNIAKALEARGYAVGVRAQIALDVHDGLLGENQGRWMLRVEDGCGRVERGGDGPVLSMDVAALGAMFSGYLSASQLRLLGRMEGSDEAVRACDGVFAGTTPWMSDSY